MSIIDHNITTTKNTDNSHAESATHSNKHTTDNSHAESATHSNKHTIKRLRLIAVVSGLLIAEYFLQSLYYDHVGRQDREMGFIGWLNKAAVVVPKSNAYIESLDLRTCKFPQYYDVSRFNFRLKDNAFVEPGNWREKNKRYVGNEDAKVLYYNIRKNEEARKYMYAKNPGLPPIQRNLTFVHIGKAGGSTIACNLRFARKYIQNHCDNIKFDEIENYDPRTANGPYIPESAISRSVHCYTHWRMDLKCMYMQGDHPFRNVKKINYDGIFGSRRLGEEEHDRHDDDDDDEKHRERKDRNLPSTTTSQSGEAYHRRNNDYLVNLRSPLDRIASWFVYEHTENHDSIYPDRPFHCGQLILSSCYQHFEHLTTIGLAGPRPHPNQPLRVGTNLSDTECSHWAWAAVQGNMPADYHNAYNYDWYAHRLLNDPVNKDADVFVLRVEHLEQDWTTVDRMLGGTGEFPSTLKSRQNDASIKPLRISHHNTTNVGVQNLCRALCDEIQVYKRFLSRAVNLQPEDLEQSMQELRQQCPDEVDIQPRVCPLD